MSNQSPTFRKELESLINRHSMENGSNTPDFILAEYLTSCLSAYDKAISWRDRWYTIAPRPGLSHVNEIILPRTGGSGDVPVDPISLKEGELPPMPTQPADPQRIDKSKG